MFRRGPGPPSAWRLYASAPQRWMESPKLQEKYSLSLRRKAQPEQSCKTVWKKVQTCTGALGVQKMKWPARVFCYWFFVVRSCCSPDSSHRPLDNVTD